MRYVMYLLGLLLLVAAGLWFFTPTLDPVYERHAGPHIRRSAPAAAVQAPSPSTRSAQQQGGQASRSAPPATSVIPRSKLSFDSVLNILNFGFGLVGMWFTWLGYRMHKKASGK